MHGGRACAPVSLQLMIIRRRGIFISRNRGAFPKAGGGSGCETDTASAPGGNWFVTRIKIGPQIMAGDAGGGFDFQYIFGGK